MDKAPSCHRPHHAPCSQEAPGREVRGQEEGRAAPSPDVVNHRGLEDAEEPVLLGVLWPFLHFSPGGGGWRERWKQVSWLQDDVLIILPATKGRRSRVINGFHGSHSSLTVLAKWRHLIGLGTIS